MQVIQPEGAAADGEWWITEEENRDLQAALTYEFAIALAYQSAFNVVYNPAQADVLLETSVVAVHPDETRGSVGRRTTPGGAINVTPSTSCVQEHSRRGGSGTRFPCC